MHRERPLLRLDNANLRLCTQSSVRSDITYWDSENSIQNMNNNIVVFDVENNG